MQSGICQRPFTRALCAVWSHVLQPAVPQPAVPQPAVPQPAAQDYRKTGGARSTTDVICDTRPLCAEVRLFQGPKDGASKQAVR